MSSSRIKLNLSRSAIGLAVLAALGTSARSLADAAPADASKTGAVLEEVVVTAQGRRENALAVPYNISAIEGADLADHQIDNQWELAKGVAGLSVVDRGYRNSGVLSGVTIRGVNATSSYLGDYQTSAVSTVSVYVNQTPVTANVLIKDVERVEVLRGPQGTLYGSGSLGGTIRYITNPPELGKMSGRVEGGLSSTDGSSGINKTGDLVLNLPLGDTVALRLLGGTQRDAGVIDYVNAYVVDAAGIPVAPKGILDPAAVYRDVKDADWVEINYGRAALLWKPNDRFSATLSFQDQSDKTGGRRAQAIGTDGSGRAYGRYENGSPILEPSHSTAQLTALEIEADLGFATLTSATSYSKQEGGSISSGTGRYASYNWLQDYYYNYPRPVVQSDRTYGDSASVEELRLISPKGERFDWIVGTYWQNQKLTAWQNDSMLGFANYANTANNAAYTTDVNWSFDRTQHYKTRSLYGELTYHVTPRLHATGGLRVFHNDFDNFTIMGGPLWSFPNVPASFGNSEGSSLFKGNLSYDVSERQLVYGTISQGYRRGGANAVDTTGMFKEKPGYERYKSDTNTNYEVGWKGSSGPVRISAAAYYIDWKNVQVDAASANWGYFIAINGGRARSQGLELEIAGVIGEAWRYSLTYGYADAHLVDAVADPVYPTKIRGAAGAPLPGVAKNTASASLEYVLHLRSGLNWSNRATIYSQSSTTNSIDPALNGTAPRYMATWGGFSQVGLASTLSNARWSASLYVKNLTNSLGITGGGLIANQGTSPAQNFFGSDARVNISRPRTIGLSLGYNF